jgi:hypothetical protein
LGKLYSAALQFAGSVGSIRIASNAPFSLPTRTWACPSSATCLAWADLALEAIAHIEASLRTELSLPANAQCSPGIDFEISPLPIREHAATTKGHIAEFLENHFGVIKAPVAPLYRTLFDTIKTRTDEEGTWADFASLKTKKGVSRTQLQQLFQNAGATRDRDADWNMVSARLTAEDFPFSRLAAVQREWRTHEIARMDATNAPLRGAVDEIGRIVSELLAAHPDTTLTALLDEVEKVFPRPAWMTASQRAAIILMEAYEYSFSSTHPQPAQTQP